MYYFYVFLVIVSTKIYAQTVDDHIIDYFLGDDVATMKKMFGKYKKPLENAIASALQDTVGVGTVNVFVEKSKDNYMIAKGYYHDDQRVELVLSDLYIEEVPRFWQPDVVLSPGSNVVKIFTPVSQIIVHAEYLLQRNKSDIIYEAALQDATKTSPFLFDKVQPTGQVAITMDHCHLTGFAMATLSGSSFNLGHAYMKLSRCQYTLEIYTLGLGVPPVIARYNPVGSGLNIDNLVMQPILAELIPKLQGAIYSFVNTTDIFGAELPKFRKLQESIMQMTSNYMAAVVRNINKLTIGLNNGAVELEDHTFSWDETGTGDSGVRSQVKLRNMVVTGLDTAYSSHAGGPFRIIAMKVGEDIRFSSIQIRGTVELINVNDATQKQLEFASEWTDVEIAVKVLVKGTDQQKRKKKLIDETTPESAPQFQNLEIMGIRAMEFSLPGIRLESLEPMIIGYLQSVVPRQLLLHLVEVFQQATDNAYGNGSKDKKFKLYSDSTENDLPKFISDGEKTAMEIDINKPELDQRSETKGYSKRGKHGNVGLKPKHFKNIVKRTKKINNTIYV